jgi:hypothetical protein
MKRNAGTVSVEIFDVQKSEVEGSEQQDNTDIRSQPFPELVSEKCEINAGYQSCHPHHVKDNNYLSAHFSILRLRRFPGFLYGPRVPGFGASANQQFRSGVTDSGRHAIEYIMSRPASARLRSTRQKLN